MASNKRPQSHEDLQRHRREQFAFLQRSAAAYDAGHVDEAKRLAATIRVLLHDTRNSKSLLGQLDEKDCQFYDTAIPDDRGNLLPYGALVQMAVSTAGTIYLPFLDDPLPAASPSRNPFEKWWFRIVFRNVEGQALSRKDLVLAVADQDGGAHVDPALDETYAALREASLGWVFQNEAAHYRVRGAELAAVRQIAHEVLKTFDPAIDVHPAVPEGAILMARGIFREVTEDELASFEQTGKPPADLLGQ